MDTSDLTFVDDAIDVYSFLLKGGRTYTIRAASADGIDPVLTLYLAGATEQAITQNDDAAPGSADAQIQITTPSDAWYLLQVDNKAPGDMRGRSYTLSARSSAPASGGGSTATTPTPAPPGDAYENNYSVETAARLGWGVPYDLSLICPEPGACRSGDHDFFLVPVKKGIPLLAVTYDLGPGADTTLTIYRPEPGFTDPSTGLVGWRVLQGNDDIAPGRTLRSQVVITPDWTGDALLVVAASDRHDPPAVPEAVGPSGRYRLI
ncbi:MAG TPA: hypothetical protein VFH51_02345, partial [Myxococcota bacterium]|nr:hypothetical protein [Myxococcota bacterium]